MLAKDSEVSSSRRVSVTWRSGDAAIAAVGWQYDERGPSPSIYVLISTPLFFKNSLFHHFHVVFPIMVYPFFVISSCWSGAGVSNVLSTAEVRR